MKIITRILIVALLLPGYILQAQSDLQNTGIVYIGTGTDTLYISGAFTNTAAATFTNNGRFYIKQNLTNSQASMAVGTGALYLNGSVAQTVGGSQPFKTFDLFTDNSLGITLNNNLDVNGTHTFMNGHIATSATPNYLIYEAGASYTGDGDNAHVNGWVKKFGSTNFTFPVGNSTVERVAAVENLSASSELNCIYRSATPNTTSVQSPIVLVNGNEYWEINKVSGGTAQVHMNWNTSKVAIPNYPLIDIRAVYYNAGLWIDQGGSASGNILTTGDITSNAVSAFGYFTLGSISVVLPLQFLTIHAQRNQDAVTVQWKTAQEFNVDHFDIERGNNYTGFSKTGSVMGNNIRTGSQYEYIDRHPLPGTVYYRVRGIDKDGRITYSNTAIVSDNNTPSFLQVLNNPVHGAIYLSASASYKGTYWYELLNTSGQLIQKGSLRITGNDIVTIPLTEKMLTGSYILSVHNEAHRVTKKIIVN